MHTSHKYLSAGTGYTPFQKELNDFVYRLSLAVGSRVRHHGKSSLTREVTQVVRNFAYVKLSAIIK